MEPRILLGGRERRFPRTERIVTDPNDTPWVPRPLTQGRYVYRNGIYRAADESLDGYSGVHVSVPGGVDGPPVMPFDMGQWGGIRGFDQNFGIHTYVPDGAYISDITPEEPKGYDARLSVSYTSTPVFDSALQNEEIASGQFKKYAASTYTYRYGISPSIGDLTFPSAMVAIDIYMSGLKERSGYSDSVFDVGTDTSRMRDQDSYILAKPSVDISSRRHRVCIICKMFLPSPSVQFTQLELSGGYDSPRTFGSLGLSISPYTLALYSKIEYTMQYDDEPHNEYLHYRIDDVSYEGDASFTIKGNGYETYQTPESPTLTFPLLHTTVGTDYYYGYESGVKVSHPLFYLPHATNATDRHEYWLAPTMTDSFSYAMLDQSGKLYMISSENPLYRKSRSGDGTIYGMERLTFDSGDCPNLVYPYMAGNIQHYWDGYGTGGISDFSYMVEQISS